jgi:indoleamine 2,3-dioxygenase
MTAMLERTAEWCAPWAFYNRVRPWVASWPAPGLVYEGADDLRPRPYAGGSAAQSALVQAIDVTLGIVHDGADTSRFLTDMRRYMTPGHRRFLAALGEGAPVRDLCAKAGGAARDAYDRAVDAVDGLRKAHTGIAVRYIINMARDEKAVGTGGTELAGFLKSTRTETKAARLASL